MRTRMTDSIETAYREAGGTAFAIEDVRLARRSASAKGGRMCSASGSSVRTATSLTRRLSRGCFRSTTRSARVRPATGSATSSSSISTSWFPIRTKSIQQGAIEPWTKTHYRAQLAELKRAAKTAGIRLDMPWKDLTDAERRDRRRRRWERLRRHSRILPLARAQEIQGARPRVPEPLSRLSDMSRVRRRPPAP